ncbi:MAG: hypothetical protein WCQ89_08100 [Verrucomicrobiota bacterium]
MKYLNLLPPDDQVLQWLLEIARRADALASRRGVNSVSDRQIWLKAEFAVFEETERARPQAVLMSAS